MPDRSSDPFSRTTLGIAAGLALLLIAGAVVAGIVLGSDSESEQNAGPPATGTPAPRTGPLALVAVDAPAAGSPECTTLTEALPDELTSNGATLGRLELAEPAPPAAAAWGGERGEPVVLRCGLNRPAELTPTSSLREISTLKWLPVEGDGATTWYTVDRTVYIALTVPDGNGTGPLQIISETIDGLLPAAGG